MLASSSERTLVTSGSFGLRGSRNRASLEEPLRSRGAIPRYVSLSLEKASRSRSLLRVCSRLVPRLEYSAPRSLRPSFFIQYILRTRASLASVSYASTCARSSLRYSAMRPRLSLIITDGRISPSTSSPTQQTAARLHGSPQSLSESREGSMGILSESISAAGRR